jgi:hypothetical protein
VTIYLKSVLDGGELGDKLSGKIDFRDILVLDRELVSLGTETADP